jgi:hypothetical protein
MKELILKAPNTTSSNSVDFQKALNGFNNGHDELQLSSTMTLTNILQPG